MKTYLVVWHSSEGKNPLDVLERLSDLGFSPRTGYHDYEYDHGREIDMDALMQFSIKVHETLRGTGVLYKLETLNPHDERL